MDQVIAPSYEIALILQRIGNKIGLLLKVDACTSVVLRGRYTRICVQIPLDTPVAALISINHHTQPLLYEEEGFLCKNYGCLCHTISICLYSLRPKQYKNNEDRASMQTTTSRSENTMSFEDNSQECQAIHFTKKKKLDQTNHHSNAKKTPIVTLKTFDVVSGEFLNPRLTRRRRRSLFFLLLRPHPLGRPKVSLQSPIRTESLASQPLGALKREGPIH